MRIAPFVLVACFLTAGPLAAGVVTWTGATNGQWSVGTNWSTGIPPAAGDDLVFPGAALNTNPTTNDLAAGTPFHSIQIMGTGTAAQSAQYTIGGNAIQLGAGGLSFTNSSTTIGFQPGPQVSLPIQLTASQTWGMDASNGTFATGLYVDGPLDLNGMDLTLDYVGSGLSPLGATIAGSGTITVNGPGFAGPELTGISPTTAPMTLNGFAEVTGSYAGPVTVENHSGFDVANGATVGAVTVNPGGAYTPGPNSGGTANSGSLTFTPASATAGTEMAAGISGSTPGTFSQANVTGTVILNDALLNLVGGVSLPAGTSLTIINNDGADPVSGTFAFLPEGALFLSSPPHEELYKITYAGGTGNDVVVTNEGTTLVTTTTLSSSRNPAKRFSSVALTVTVSSPQGIPQGFVRIFDGATRIATELLDATGHATANVLFATIGTHNLTARYDGLVTSAGAGVGSSTSATLAQVIVADVPTLDPRSLLLLGLVLAAIGVLVIRTR